MNPSITYATVRTEDLDSEARAVIVQLCMAAHQKENFQNLFSHNPPGGLPFLAYAQRLLVAHAVVTTRWLQPEGMPLLKTGYVAAVAILPGKEKVVAARSCANWSQVFTSTPLLVWKRSRFRSTRNSVGNSGGVRWRDDAKVA